MIFLRRDAGGDAGGDASPKGDVGEDAERDVGGAVAEARADLSTF